MKQIKVGEISRLGTLFFLFFVSPITDIPGAVSKNDQNAQQQLDESYVSTVFSKLILLTASVCKVANVFIEIFEIDFSIPFPIIFLHSTKIKNKKQQK